MGFRKNGVSLGKGLSRSVLVSSFMLLTGFASSVSATNYCSPEIDQETGTCKFLNGSIYVDFLYWQVNTEGLEFARKNGIAATANDSLAASGELFDTTCSMEPGVRAGLIINLGQCDWDLAAQYTYLSSEFGVSDSVPFGTPGLQPLIFTVSPPPPIFQEFSDINLALGRFINHMNVLDVGFGKTFKSNNCFEFRPHVGIKATWQKLKHIVSYEKILSLVPPPEPPEPQPPIVAVFQRYIANFETDFEGVGPRCGFDALWRFNRCFSAVGSFSASGVWSDMTLSRKDFLSLFVLNPATFDFDEQLQNQEVDIKSHQCVVIPVVELVFGIRWEDSLCGCYPIHAFFGWESQIWFNLSRPILVSQFGDNNNYSFGPRGNISYQGLVVRLGVGF